MGQRREVTPAFAVAHRAPASAAACTALHAAGASVFELDVQLSERGVVVSHFRPLPRPLHSVERDNWRVRRGQGLVQDPLLHDALTLLPADVRVLLDLKERTRARSHELCRRLAAELEPSPRWIVSTDVVTDLETMRAAGFGVWRTARDPGSLRRLLAEPADHDGVSVRHLLLDRGTVEQLRQRGPAVVAWTVNSSRRARYLLDIGVSGITTDSSRVVAAVAASSA